MTSESSSPLNPPTSQSSPIPYPKNGISFSRLTNPETHKNFFELIKCKICFNILNNPYDCTKCGNSFCYDCIQSVLTAHKSCPFKCDDFSIKPSSLSIMSYLSKLSFTCINKANGCEEIIPYSNIIEHDKNCKYFYTKCPNVQCGIQIKWTLIEAHLKNDCPFTLFKCDRCGIELFRDDINEHMKNCDSIRTNMNYQINTDNKKYIDDYESVMKGMAELKEASLLSFMKAIMYQINVNNAKLNAKFDAMKTEINGIHEDIDRVCKNNMIFFESINTELENINNKVSLSTSDNQNEMLTTLTNEDINGKKNLTSSNSNNNSLISDHPSINSSRRVKFSPKLEMSDEFTNHSISNNNNNNYTNHTKAKSKVNENNSFKRVKTVQIGKSGFGSGNKSYSPKNSSDNKTSGVYYPPTARPFNTFSSYTNSNLVNIINNQEIIISKLNALEKKCDEGNLKVINEIKENQIKYLNMFKEKVPIESDNVIKECNMNKHETSEEELKEDELINKADEIKEVKTEDEYSGNNSMNNYENQLVSQ